MEVAPDTMSQLNACDKNPITENFAGEGAECGFYKKSTISDDGARQLGEAHYAVSLGALLYEKDGTAF